MMKPLRILFFCSCCLFFFGCKYSLSAENEEYTFTAKIYFINKSSRTGYFFLNSDYFLLSSEADDMKRVKVSSGDSLLTIFTWSSEIEGDYYRNLYVYCKYMSWDKLDDKVWIKADAITKIYVTDVISAEGYATPKYFDE